MMKWDNDMDTNAKMYLDMRCEDLFESSRFSAPLTEININSLIN